MTEAIEQLASKLSVENSEIENFLKKLSIRFDQPVTAEEVLELIEPLKKNSSFDNFAQYIEQKLINSHIQKNNQLINEFQNKNLDNINLFKSRINLYTKIIIFSNKDVFELHNFLNKNRRINNENLKDTISYLSRTNSFQNYIFEYIQLVTEFKKPNFPFKNPDRLIDNIFYKTGLKINIQQLSIIIENYNIEFDFLDYCYICTRILENLHHVKNISKYLLRVPKRFKSFKAYLAKSSNKRVSNNSNTINTKPEIIQTKNTLLSLLNSLNKIPVKNSQSLQDRANHLWQEITSNKREYAIPSQGILVIETEDDIAKRTYLKSFRFIQEGFTAPSVKLELSIHIPAKKSNAFNYVIIKKDGSITGFIDNIQNQGYKIMLRYLLIATYHALVVPKSRKPATTTRSSNRDPSTNYSSNDSRRSAQRTKSESNRESINNWHQNVPKTPHIVVGYQRFQEDGFEAAPEKKLQAQAAGVTLKPGYTWVQEHTRGGTDAHSNSNQFQATRLAIPVSVTSHVRECLTPTSSSLRQSKSKKRR